MSFSADAFNEAEVVLAVTVEAAADDDRWCGVKVNALLTSVDNAMHRVRMLIDADGNFIAVAGFLIR